jgi:P pilus assembly chaperone PapD
MKRDSRIITSTILIRLVAAISCALACAATAFALGQTRYVEFSQTLGSLQLVNDHSAAPMLVDSQDYAGVVRAARWRLACAQALGY